MDTQPLASLMPQVPWWRSPRVLILICVVVGAVAAAVTWYFMMHARTASPATTTAPVTVESAFNDNNLDQALALENATLATDPNNVEALIDKSLILSQMGSLGFKETEYGTQAAAVANQAIGLDATSSEAYRALGYANEIQQNYTDAHTDYQKAIALDPSNALALFDDAHTYDLQGDLVKAEAGYRASLAVSRFTWDAYIGLARIDISKGNTTEAISYLKIIYGSAPNVHEKAEAAYSLGTLLMNQGNLDSAQTYLKEATLLDPTYPSGWSGLGSLYYARVAASSTVSVSDRAQYLINSMTALDMALKLNSNQSVAYLQMAEDLNLLGRKADALKAIADAQAAVPNDITLTPQGKTSLLKQISVTAAIIQAQKGN